MEEKKIGYKLVMSLGEQQMLVSCVAEGYLCKRYALLETTRADKGLVMLGYGLCLFADMESLKKFISPSMYRKAVLECEYGGEMPLPKKRLVDTGAVDSLANFSKFLDFTYEDEYAIGWPAGTIMCQWVKPIKIVEVYGDTITCYLMPAIEKFSFLEKEVDNARM